MKSANEGGSAMKKLVIRLAIGLIVLLLMVLVIGCQQQPTPAPELAPPTPTPPPAPELAPPTPTPPPAPEPAPPTPTPPPEPEPPPVDEEETVESPAHSSAYVKFEGIDGEVESGEHEDWSEIVSFSQPISKPASGATGTTRRRGDVVLEDIVVVKQLDKASPKLAEAICMGKVFPKVEIHLTGPSEGSTCLGTFYAYELKNVMITNYEVSGSNPLAYALIAPAPDTTMPSAGPFIVQAVDAPMEVLSLNFEEIKVTYTECGSSGLAKGNVEYSWKVEEAES